MAAVPVITRFAPSPTGYLHVGGARTALFCWLLARNKSGRFCLRIEDTDLARSTEQACAQLLEDLQWLGLQWDNPVLIRQSQRTAVYNRLIDGLISQGKAYRAYETPQELDAMRQAAQAQRRAFVYRRGPLPPDEDARLQAQGRPHVVRFAMPVKPYAFTDEALHKEVALPAEEAQDFVIRKADGMPTYHFAVVADDAEMGITHVLRGQEHLKNTFYHIALQEALGYPRPLYLHLPIILNTDGSKMGKRDRDKAVRHRAQLWLKQHQHDTAPLAAAAGLDQARLDLWLADAQKQLDLPEQKGVMAAVGMSEADLPEVLVHDFRRNGYLPEALLNFLALLGWSPGQDRERMAMQEMVQLFAIDGIGQSNARFDRTKLLAFNTEALAAASPQRLLAAFRDYLAANPDSPLNQASDAELTRLLKMKPGMRLLREVDAQSRFFFIADEQIPYDPAAVEKVLRKQDGLSMLQQIKPLLAALSDWTAPHIEAAVKAFCEPRSLALGKVAQPLRVAVCGTTVSPPIFESLEILGQQRTLGRIERCLLLP